MIKLTLRLPEDLHKAIKELAKRENRSLNNMIVYMLQEYFRRLKEKS